MKQITIYSKNNCPHCVRAKLTLTNKGIPFTTLTLDEDFTRDVLLEMFPTAKTFPVIVIDGFYIGGADQLEKLINEETHTNQKLLIENKGI